MLIFHVDIGLFFLSLIFFLLFGWCSMVLNDKTRSFKTDTQTIKEGSRYPYFGPKEQLNIFSGKNVCRAFMIP